MNIELKDPLCQLTHDIVWISCCYRYDNKNGKDVVAICKDQ